MVMDAELEVLTKGREYVKKGWTQGAYARNANGIGVSLVSSTAVKFCASGALLRAAGMPSTGLLGSTYMTARDKLAKAMEQQAPYVGSIPAFNDTHTQREVLKAFDAAIEKRKQELS